MKHTILTEILSYKSTWIIDQEKKNPLNTLKYRVQKSQHNFYKTLLNKKNETETIFILECKKSSPSQGIIRKNFNPIDIANIYKNYSTVISVVTDEKYFHGNFNILYQISNNVTQPVLCKDFFISEWQIYFARLYQADAILLMLSIIDDITYQKFTRIAHELNMGVITEIINDNELHRAISLGAKVIGINNRNLHDLSIDINRTIKLSKKIPNKTIIISESGIKNHHHIKKLRQYVHGFLIGTTLMSQPQLDLAIKKMILGENKICGLTQIKDAYIAQKEGAIYGGLIFVDHSPRHIDTFIAKKIVSTVQKLQYVGVFYNSNISHIIKIVNKLNLSSIQLHGNENQDYISNLRKKLPNTCRIWKSINMQSNNSLLLFKNVLHVNRYLADNSGGSGKTFDWKLLSKVQLHNTILAGGLTIENCSKAATLGCIGLDINSGVEIAPGIKDHQKIKNIFKILRNY